MPMYLDGELLTNLNILDKYGTYVSGEKEIILLVLNVLNISSQPETVFFRVITLQNAIHNFSFCH